MSRIDDLIEELCPDGVQSYPLWKLTIWDKKFNAVDRCKQAETRRYTYFLASEIKGLSVASGGTVKLLSTGTEDYGWTTPDIAGDEVSDAEIVAIPWGGTPSVQYYKGLFLTSDNRIAIVKDPELLSTRFLYYSLLLRIKEITSFYRGAGIQHPNMAKVLDLRIPVPPLEVQREIVKILDAFTVLEAELEAELEARQKQYQYYRNELLSFDGREDVRWATLDKTCQINRGRVMSKDYLRDNAGQYPVYSSQTANGGVFGFINSFDYDFESITWTTDGANAGSVFYHADEQFSITNVCGLLKVLDSSSLSAKFLYYILGVSAKRYVNDGMGNPKLMSNVMSQIKVPIPPIEEQARIVKILDKFDALVNDISSGLPAEIAARRGQYAYYRDKLLSFKETA